MIKGLLMVPVPHLLLYTLALDFKQTTNTHTHLRIPDSEKI